MLYRPTYTKPIPPGAEIFVKKSDRLARWTDGRGRTRTAKVTTTEQGVDRLTFTSPFWRFRYRNGAGVECDVPTHCRDEVAAQSVANELTRRAELVRAGTITSAEEAAADHQGTPVVSHLEGYLDHLRVKGGDSRRIRMVRSRIGRLVVECGFGRLCDLDAVELEKWLVARKAANMGAATRNCYREAIVGFGNWCRRTRRLMSNPFRDVPIADAKGDRRRQRRALTAEELTRLLVVARLRPLAEYGRAKVRVNADPERPKRTSWSRAPLTFDAIPQAAARARLVLNGRRDLAARLEAVGRERALIYKTLALTGLRKGELASLTVGQLDLDAAQPYVVLDAADEKNRHGSEIPLRLDLAADIQAFLADRLKAVQDAARLRIGEPIPVQLPRSQRLFGVPSGLIRILDRDLRAAGIPKRDDRNRVVDVHAMRTTFGTHLSKGGVPLRTAQAAMRHSKPELTANVYTDPRLLDVAGALDALPALPLDDGSQSAAAKATGTDAHILDNDVHLLACALAPRSGIGSITTGTNGHLARCGTGANDRSKRAGSGCSVNKNGSRSSHGHEPRQKRAMGLEPTTFTLAT